MSQNKIVAIALEYPMELPDGPCAELRLRRPTMGDILSYPIKGQDDVEGEMRLYCALTGLGMDDMKRMDTADYEKLQQSYASFRSKKDKGNK